MSSFPLELPEQLTVGGVKLTWNDWQMLLTHASELIMDASVVREIDTAGMQLARDTRGCVRQHGVGSLSAISNDRRMVRRSGGMLAQQVKSGAAEGALHLTVKTAWFGKCRTIPPGWCSTKPVSRKRGRSKCRCW